MNRFSCFFLSLFLLSTSTSVFAIESGVNVYGFSYHPERTDSKGNKFQEWNPGLGYHATLRDTRRSILFADAGIFVNSLSSPTLFSAAGAEIKIHSGISAGLFGAFIYSSAYNSGKPIVAPLPSLSFRHGQFRFNATYIPKYKQNDNAAFGFSFTWFP
jgi:hypothetical protein